MAPSTSVADPQPSSTTDSFNSNAAAENDIRPFFVLHKASSGSKPTATVKAKRRIESPSPKLAKKSEIESVEEEDGQFFSTLRLKVFETVWSKIENTIQDVLRDSNSKVFSGVHNWICESFESVRSSGALSLSEAVRSYPVLSQPSSKQLFTALVLTRNLEMVDDLSTFEDLGLHLKSQGCHVAKLSSMDFSAKNGVGGCLRGLLRQFVMPTIDVADVTVLASWYRENGNHKNPVVIIVDDTERCSGSVLSDLILILSEWAVKVPIFLIMGVSTAHDAPRKILSANALQRLCASRFTLSSPAERMDAVLEAVFLKPCSGFTVSHKVALFMRSYFLCQDGTLTSFVKTLKIACLQHFSLEPLSIMLEHFCQDNQLPGEGTGLLTEATMKHAFDLPSVTRNKITRSTCEMLPQFLLDLQRMPNPWSIVVLCIYEAGKFDKLRLLDIFCETLDPEARYLKYFAPSAILNSQSHVSGRNSVIRRVLRKLSFSSVQMASLSTYFLLPNLFNKILRISLVNHVRSVSEVLLSRVSKPENDCVVESVDLSPAQLSSLLKSWESLTAEFSEINEKVMELHPFMRNVEAAGQRPGLPTSPKKHASRSHSKLEKELKAMTDKISAVIEFMLREYMKPVETVPFNEILCFKNVDKLQSALLGDPRGRIQSDLLESHSILNCLCCSQRGTTLLPSMHDTSILYALAQEHADVINLHDWYQSFKTILIPRNSKAKSKSKTTSKSKKRKERCEEPEPPAEASIQARFCRAVMELQIAGLIRMPSKRRPDFVQRVAFSS
ncbi:BnaC09g41200D [Brassica napus]|uniref:BnaC09g41200D protein n=1 Tax=Brassica napus TaxID=3708 RepID=A0A078II72_BRANA|nr:BnaC09g41200D [Brassica napus]